MQNDGPVTVVVAKNFEEIVLDPTKDVMLEVRPAVCITKALYSVGCSRVFGPVGWIKDALRTSCWK